MGKATIIGKIHDLVASIGWRLFLWGTRLTQEEYWRQIYEQEKSFYAHNQKEEGKE